MNKKGESRTKAFEFMTLFMMVLGTVIGSGIYMKNNELLIQTKNPIIGIILWLVVGIICVLSVVVFIEISSSTKHFGNGTVGNWSKLFIGRKIASLFSLAYVIMYIPSNYAIFTGAFVTFLFQAIGMEVSGSVQLTIYLICGIVMLLIFTVINTFKPTLGGSIQFFGTIFKFIPLSIALIAGFVMIDKNSAMWNGGYGGESWSADSFDAALFLRGFGAILFSFDGYIYIANAQKGAKHKEVVPKALFFGMIFVTIFYVLIAISLFLGSPDGSIVTLFEKMLSGGQDPQNVSGTTALVSRVISNTLLMIICLLNVNVFTTIGVVSIESDIDAKILYNGGKTHVDKVKAGFIQLGISIVFYSIFVLLGFFVARDGWHGINTTVEDVQTTLQSANPDKVINYAEAKIYWINKPAEFLGIISSADCALAFLMVDALIFAAVVNRFTHKVNVEKNKGTITIGIISGVLMLMLVIFGIYSFIDTDPTHTAKWTDTTGPWFTILFFGSVAVTIIVWLIQEKLFKLHPYKNGFEGQLSDDEINLAVIEEARFEKILSGGKYANGSIKRFDPVIRDKKATHKDKKIK